MNPKTDKYHWDEGEKFETQLSSLHFFVLCCNLRLSLFLVVTLCSLVLDCRISNYAAWLPRRANGWTAPWQQPEILQSLTSIKPVNLGNYVFTTVSVNEGFCHKRLHGLPSCVKACFRCCWYTVHVTLDVTRMYKIRSPITSSLSRTVWAIISPFLWDMASHPRGTGTWAAPLRKSFVSLTDLTKFVTSTQRLKFAILLRYNVPVVPFTSLI